MKRKTSWVLVQELERPCNGYWDGGAKQIFVWEIENRHRGTDSKGTYVRIGCWEANYWFHVAEGKTDKITLCNAMKHLKAITKVPSIFHYEQKWC
jgi:hypothetical protein